MSRVLESWLHSPRLARAVAAVIVGAGILIWLTWFGPPERVARDKGEARVAAVDDGGFVTLELDDGKQVRLRPRVRLRAGERVPTVVERYADGPIIAWVDEDTQRMW
jgi:ferric-dicitrate binding protein FerR (iron transport regulator)